MHIIFFIITLLFYSSVYAESYGDVTGYKIPRFVSLKSDEINLRVGPSINYPIKITYVYQNFPVEIIDEYDVWRKVRDNENNIGWIRGNLLKGDRYGIVISKEDQYANIYKYPKGVKMNPPILKKENIPNKINSQLPSSFNTDRYKQKADTGIEKSH